MGNQELANRPRPRVAIIRRPKGRSHAGSARQQKIDAGNVAGADSSSQHSLMIPFEVVSLLDVCAVRQQDANNVVFSELSCIRQRRHISQVGFISVGVDVDGRMMSK
jgi:RNase P/RNase MRP subunit p30